MARINLNESVKEALIVMAEGNPGALTVMMSLIKDNVMSGFIDICRLDDLEIYGSGIWIGYEDFCGMDIQKFKEAIREKDPEMLSLIRQTVAQGG